MNSSRLIKKVEANKKGFNGIEILEYYTQQVSDLGLAAASISGTYPPSSEAKWSLNEAVEEMWYVVSGAAKIIYNDGQSVELVKDSAAHIPRGMKYRVEDATGLGIVIATGPAWTPEQHKWVDE